MHCWSQSKNSHWSFAFSFFSFYSDPKLLSDWLDQEYDQGNLVRNELLNGNHGLVEWAKKQTELFLGVSKASDRACGFS